MKHLAALPLLLALIATAAVGAEPAAPGAAIGAVGQAVQQQEAAPAPAAPVPAPANTAPQPQGAATAPRAEPAAPAAPATAAPAAPGSAASLMQVIFGLIVVLGLLAAALWALKRFGGMRMSAGAPLKIVGGVSVGNRERVLVLEIGEQWLVVGVAPGRVSMLTSMPRGQQPGAAGPAQAPDFGAWLKKTIEKRNVK
jgi:flagellar protein FliO/FliZ